MIQIKFKLTLIIPVLAILVQIGCQPPVSHLRPLWLQIDPLINTEKDFDFDKADYRTFSVMPATKTFDKSQITSDIQEKHLMYQLRNALELKGYKFVAIDQNPDLIAIIDGSINYKTQYVPPRNMVVPQWVPGKTSTITTNSTASASAYGSAGWANAYGTGTSTSYVSTPGYMTSNVVTRPGYEQGFYYPSLFIGIYNANTKKIVWKGTGVGTTSTSDLRIADQWLMGHILKPLPNQVANLASEFTPDVGRIGIGYQIYTVDGDNYFPTLTTVTKGLPADKAGIHTEDVIVRVNGQDCKNITETDFNKLLRGRPGEKIHLSIWRNGEQGHREFDIIRVQRSQ